MDDVVLNRCCGCSCSLRRLPLVVSSKISFDTVCGWCAQPASLRLVDMKVNVKMNGPLPTVILCKSRVVGSLGNNLPPIAP